MGNILCCQKSEEAMKIEAVNYVYSPFKNIELAIKKKSKSNFKVIISYS